jgi:hypothetical protein
MGRNPRYFFVAFGYEYYLHHPVDGGHYGHGTGYIFNSGISLGDVMLLYCTRGYPDHDQEAPGIGVVTGIDLGKTDGIISYQYFPLHEPVSWEAVKCAVPELRDRGKRNFSRKGNWLRKIANSSFRATLTGKLIDWP